MINILKKIPIFEIIYILGLNFLLFVWGFLIFILITSFYHGDNKSVPIPISEYVNAAVCIIIPIYFYWMLFRISINKIFYKVVYFFKFNTIFRWIMYLVFCIISPGLLAGLSLLECDTILYGFETSFAAPLMLLYGYWGLEDKLSLKARKVYGYINKIILVILSFLIIGLIYHFVIGDNLYDPLNIFMYTLIILTGIFICLSIKIEVITEKIKKYKWHCLFLWMSVIYASMWGIRNEWLNYYVIYISVVLLIMLVFEKPILRLKAKNTELRREAEVLYRR